MEISIAPELEKYVAGKVASGGNSSASEVLAAGLEALQAEDRSLGQWLVDEVVPTYEEMKAHPELAIPIDEVFADLRRHHLEQRRPCLEKPVPWRTSRTERRMKRLLTMQRRIRLSQYRKRAQRAFGV